ncbi:MULTISPECIES: 2OG-Fe dioxygenase family protein [unclassified Streptomyces]|uniref:2OG-Fe dioxygenase family protein n=1 Tax=unclassified Streptomyces TaxID=2593676 RepID=UPI00332A2229
MDHLVDISGRTPIAPSADPAAAAGQALATIGAHLMPAAATMACLGVDEDQWRRFTSHWEFLTADPYASERGTRRLRRYGHFVFSAPRRCFHLLPPDTFVQPEDSNPLYVDVDRRFDPLTSYFVADPVVGAVLRMLGRLATGLDDSELWDVKVHPFRVIASGDAEGLPTPEGLHRDGVTLVSSLMVGRRNATGGESEVCDMDGKRLLATTLDEPGTLLLGDDRRTLHGVSAVRPRDSHAQARRDVLVVTFAPRGDATTD